METEVIVNLIDILNSLWSPVKTIALLVGYLLIGLGLFWFAMSQDKSKGVSAYSSGMMVVAGILLVSMDSFLNIASYSVLESKSNLDALGYSASDAGSQAYEKIIYLAFAAVKFMGLIAGIKGIYTMYTMSENQNQSVFTVVMYMFLAVIGLNFPQFMDIVGNSLGGSVETSIDRLMNAVEQ